MKPSPETRLFRAHWQDGTLDLVAGGSVLLIGIGYLFEQMLAEIVVVPLALAAWVILRRRVVEPRAGHVQFARLRRRRSARELLATVVVGIGLGALCVALVLRARAAAPTISDAVDAVPALLVAVAALVAAGLTRTWRFALYALVIAAAAAGAVLLEAGPAMPLLLGGAIVAGTGGLLLARFMAECRRGEAAE